MTNVQARPAATVVLIRNQADELEVLLVRRGERGAFSGVWAFPGGRVDPEDDDPLHPGDELAAARRAAVRETAEEVGLAVDAASFVPLSHWTPPLSSPRRFTTWFFLAEAPATGDIVVDGDEIADHRWLRPADALAARDAGDLVLVAPTWVTLRWLADAGPTADALAAADGADPPRFATNIVLRPDGPLALWDGDAGYETGDPDVPGARHRLWMATDGPWRYERTT